MMISKKMEKRLNLQVTHEFYSAWLYRAMSYSLEEMGLQVFARWFMLQMAEETLHAEKIVKYIIEQDATVSLDTIPKPEGDFSSVQTIVKGAVDHEIIVTKQIHEIMDLAIKENDHATRSIMQWFVDEQVEEVASAKELFDMVKHIKDPGQLIMLEERVQQLVNARQTAV